MLQDRTQNWNFLKFLLVLNLCREENPFHTPCTFKGELSAELNTTDLRATTLPTIGRQMQSVQRHCKVCPVPLLAGRQAQSRGQVQCGRGIACPASDSCMGQMGMERRLPGSLDASQKQSRLQHSKKPFFKHNHC